MSSRGPRADPTITRWQAFNAVKRETHRACQKKNLADYGIEVLQ